jgi:acyl carrier protein
MTEQSLSHASPLSVDTIQNWLINRIASLLGTDPGQICVDDPLSDFGLESVEAFTLSGELSALLGTKLSPTLAWDFPTITALAAFLAEGQSAATHVQPNL